MRAGRGRGWWKHAASVLAVIAVLAGAVAPVHAQDPEIAKYDINFEGLWDTDALADGVAVPDDAHFSNPVVGVHNGDVSFWAAGGQASAGLEALAETGAISGFRAEMDAEKPDNVHRTHLFSPGTIGATQTKRIPFYATREHSRVTVAVMIAPSPDWFVGVAGLDLREDGVWRTTFSVDLYPYDAGTEQGAGFSTDNPDDDGAISSIRNQGKFSNNPIARLTFTLREPPRVKGVEVVPGDGQVEVSWTAIDIATGYKVQWRSSQQTFADAAANGREAVVGGGTTTDHTITGLTNGTVHVVRVLATNAQGDGRPSVRVRATPVAGGTSMVVSGGVSITSAPGSDGEYVVGDDIEITVTFSRAVTVTGTPRIGIRLNAARTADYAASKSTTTALVFSYTVTAADYDQNGIGVPENGLSLNGGTITDTSSGNAAVLSFTALADASRHKVLRIPVAISGATRVASTPASGTSYRTGETITIEVPFDRNVQIFSPDAAGTLSGVPSYELVFGVPDNATLHQAAYARVVDGSKIQFDYVVQAGDYDPNGITAMDPAVRSNGGAIIRAEMDAEILSDGVGDDGRERGEANAKIGGTYLPHQPGHRVNALSVALSVDPASVAESAGATTATVTGTADGTVHGSDIAVTIAVGDSWDEAVEGTDYGTVGDVTLTITAGATRGTATFVLAPAGDDLVEDDEFVSVTGTTTATGVTVEGTELAIIDDDTHGVTVSRASLTVTEGGTGTYTVVLTSEPTGPVTVTPSVSGSSDVTANPSVLTFLPSQWDTPKTVTVSLADDGDSNSDGYAAQVSHAVAGADYGANGIAADPVRVYRNQQASQLTAHFRQVPGSHDGTNLFTFRVGFTEELANRSGRNLRRALSVSGGTTKSVRRGTETRNLFTVRIEPGGTGDVVLSLGPSTTDCTANDALCTSGGMALTGTVTGTVGYVSRAE